MAAAVLGLGAGDMSAGYVRPVAATDPSLTSDYEWKPDDYPAWATFEHSGNLQGRDLGIPVCSSGNCALIGPS